MMRESPNAGCSSGSSKRRRTRRKKGEKERKDSPRNVTPVPGPSTPTPELDDPPKRFGIGAALDSHEEGGATITRIVEDGAAAREGTLQPGDRIVAVRSRPGEDWLELTPDLTLAQVVEAIVGPEGAPVGLRILRKGTSVPTTLHLQRAPLPKAASSETAKAPKQ